MEKRVIVFLVISLAVIIGYDFLLKEMGLMPAPVQMQEAQAPDSADSSAPPASASVPSTAATGSSTADQPAKSAAGSSIPAALEAGPAGATDEQLVEVETDLFRAKFSNRGGVLKSWELKRYTGTVDDGQKPVQLVYSGGRF